MPLLKCGPSGVRLSLRSPHSARRKPSKRLTNLTAERTVSCCIWPPKFSCPCKLLTCSMWSQVLLVGGATRMPAFLRFVKNMTGLEPKGFTVDPDEVQGPAHCTPLV